MKLIFKHIIFWVAYIGYEYAILLFTSPENIPWKAAVIGFTMNAAVFYGCSKYVFPLGETTKKRFLSFLFLLAFVSGYIGLSLALAYLLLPDLEGIGATAITPAVFAVRLLWRVTWFIALAFGYSFAREAVRVEKTLRLAEQEKFRVQLGEEKLQRELSLARLINLRNQLNPHFFFNTLNFFYGAILPLSRPLADSFAKLASIMRYAMKAGEQSDLEPLTEEIDIIQDFIALNQLRFDHQLPIILQVTGDPHSHRIPIFTCMTLVENAFKHGDLTDQDYPLFINLEIKPSSVRFSVANKKNRQQPFSSHGIGLRNLVKRLQLTYGSRYDMQVTDGEDNYEIYLTIATDDV